MPYESVDGPPSTQRIILSYLRFAFRTLARNRSFTLVTVLTLALGIGSAASIFSVTDWVLFRASKFPDDVCLVGGQTDGTTVMPMHMDFQARAYEAEKSLVSGMAAGVSREQAQDALRGAKVRCRRCCSSTLPATAWCFRARRISTNFPMRPCPAAA